MLQSFYPLSPIFVPPHTKENTAIQVVSGSQSSITLTTISHIFPNSLQTIQSQFLLRFRNLKIKARLIPQYRSCHKDRLSYSRVISKEHQSYVRLLSAVLAKFGKGVVTNSLNDCPF